MAKKKSGSTRKLSEKSSQRAKKSDASKPKSERSSKKSRSTSPKSTQPQTTKGAHSRGAKSAPQTGTRGVSSSTAKPQRKRSTSHAQRPLTRSEQRSAAATLGWVTRRRNALRGDRLVVKANPDDVEAGDFAFTLYNKAHPIFGEHEVKEYWQNNLRKYYGHKVKVTVNGYVNDENGERKARLFIRRVGAISGYGDVFGAGSLFADVVHTIRNRYSTDELVITSMTVELADSEDTDDEGNE